jgi:serine/threonine protein kinase
MATADRQILLMLSQGGQHQNVVRYFGFEEDAKCVYLALELCEVSLWSIFNEEEMKEKRIEFRSPEKRQYFVSQLLEGIRFLHSLQIVHGDLRPKNVLFDYSGQLKITDFGLSQKITFADDSFTWQVIYSSS